jgi:hypothetical protein
MDKYFERSVIMRSKVFLISAFLVGIPCFLANSFAFDIGYQEVGVTLTESFVSRYIWRGQDLYGNNDGAYQPSIDITLPGLLGDADVSLNVWGSFSLNKGHEDAEELDYTLTFSRDMLDAFDISAGYTYFDFPNANDKSDVQEPWASVTLNKIPALPIDVSMTVFAGYDFKAASGGPDEGWYYSWGFDTELPLPPLPFFQEGQTLAMGIVNWGNDGVADLKPSGLYATEFSLSTSYDIAGFSVSPGFNYIVNHKEEINSGDEEVWCGIEISYLF